MDEAIALLGADGFHVDHLRVQGFPFGDEVMDFIPAHEKVLVIGQNESGPLRRLLIEDGKIAPAKLGRVLHYGGMY